MGSIFGNNIKIALFGESHGEGVGVTIDGFPAGLAIDETFIRTELDRRKPGQSIMTTMRKEGDLPQVISGIYKGRTTGSPINVWFKNQDTKSQDYESLKMHYRPSHADYTGKIRYEGYNDPRGGGHFSGRLTVGIVYAGALMKQWLSDQGVHICGHISQIGEISDLDLCEQVKIGCPLSEEFPMYDPQCAMKAKQLVDDVRMNLDSIGAKLTVGIFGMPCGIGNPIFDQIESQLSYGLFAVPGVKGVSFGSGFDLVKMKGSEANDRMREEDGRMTTLSNHSGGVNGGITNGMPIICSVAMKPTASIAMGQETWAEEDGMKLLQIKGRHDPCIGIRALPVVEAMAALVAGDFLIAAVNRKV